MTESRPLYLRQPAAAFPYALRNRSCSCPRTHPLLFIKAVSRTGSAQARFGVRCQNDVAVLTSSNRATNESCTGRRYSSNEEECRNGLSCLQKRLSPKETPRSRRAMHRRRIVFGSSRPNFFSNGAETRSGSSPRFSLFSMMPGGGRWACPRARSATRR